MFGPRDQARVFFFRSKAGPSRVFTAYHDFKIGAGACAAAGILAAHFLNPKP